MLEMVSRIKATQKREPGHSRVNQQKRAAWGQHRQQVKSLDGGALLAQRAKSKCFSEEKPRSPRSPWQDKPVT